MTPMEWWSRPWRLEAVRNGNADAHAPTVQRVRQEAKRLSRQTKHGQIEDFAALAALAYPDRIGLRRAGDAPRFVLSGGKGAVLPAGDALSGSRMLVATDLDGDPREARIRQAITLPMSTLRELFADQIDWVNTCHWSRRTNRVETRRQEKFFSQQLKI